MVTNLNGTENGAENGIVSFFCVPKVQFLITFSHLSKETAYEAITYKTEIAG